MTIDTSLLAAFLAQRTLAMIDDVTANTAMTESMATAATAHAAIEASVARIGARGTARWLRTLAKQVDRDRDRYEAAAAARRAAKATPRAKV